MRRFWVPISVAMLSCALGVMPSIGASSVTVATIDVPGATETFAYGINTAGQIVGSSTVGSPSSYHWHGFMLAGGRFTPIDVPGATDIRAYGINAAGQIVGDFQDAGRMWHGYVRSPSGAFTTIDVPGATSTSDFGINAFGINAAGQIVGDFPARDKIHGYVATPTR